MFRYQLLLIAVLLNVASIRAQEATGSILPKSYSALAQEPAAVASKSLTPNCGCIRVLSFDDISYAGNTQYNTISNGYGGLNWVNAYYLNTTWERFAYGWNGYATAKTSGIFVAFNGGGQAMTFGLPVGQYFQLNSVSLSAAWNNNLQLTIKGTRNNVLIYQTVVSLQVATRTMLYTLKWANIDKISFAATGGTPYPGLSGSGTHFAIDDLDITM